MEKLSGPAYIPNPLTSPALMVLASTAEAARSSSSSPGPINDYHAVYSSPSNRYIDGETVHRMVLNSTHYQHRSSHLSLYPGSEHYAERIPHDFGPHFLQLHHHLGGGLLHKTSGSTAVFNGTGAFRRVLPPEHAFPFHHMQHQRTLLEREHVESLYKNTELDKEVVSKEKILPLKPEKDNDIYLKRNRSKSPSPKRMSVLDDSKNNTVDGLNIKREQSENTECCNSPGSDDIKTDGNSPKGRRRSSSQAPCCPICGTTIRPGEMESHFAWEMERFCEENRKLRRSQREAPLQTRKNGETFQRKWKQEGKADSSQRLDDTPASTRQQTYLRVCANRMARNGRSTALKPTRSRSSQSSPLHSPMVAEEGPSGVKTTICPVCEEVIHGSSNELNSHVESCLRKKEGGEVDDNDDTSAHEVFEEYEWAGQTRIRATSLLEGGFRASGFQTGIKRRREDEDVGDLNIDGDDSEEYGKPQYTEADVILCQSDEQDEDDARQVLRDAVISGESSPTEKSLPRENCEGLDEDDPSQTKSKSEDAETIDDRSSNPDLVICSLKARLKELGKMKLEKVKCLICMEPYTNPLTSISCWHVHCEECWLRTLGAKKLCPQCNMITSPSDLRKIYL